MGLVLLDVMTGIENRLKTIDGLRTSSTIPDQIMPPTAVVPIPNVNYKNGLARSRMSLQGTILIFTSKGWTRTGQEQLTQFVDLSSELSVVAAIDGDRTLGGACGDCTVSDFRQLTDAEFGEIGYCGGVFTLDIL